MKTTVYETQVPLPLGSGHYDTNMGELQMSRHLITNFSRYCLLGVIWSTVVVFTGFQVISTAWAHACNGHAQDPQKRRITAVLFDLDEDDVDDSTNYTYNDYECHPEWWEEDEKPGYNGGHAGWDVQTKPEDDNRDAPFYSLTTGEVIRADEGNREENSVIAVYNSVYDITIIYLHAGTVEVEKEAIVKKGDYLGKQGNTGLNENDDETNSHLHVEIRKGEWENPSNGIAAAMLIDHDPIPINHDPIPILFKMLHDVNQDRRVDNIDALLVFLHIGADADDLRQYDINNDGDIDITDLILIMNNRDTQLAAPTRAESTPDQTLLLANYPNPFNPETWIPYKLSKPTEVTVTIHAADGSMVRTLVLGHQPAGVYQDKNRAAYWDGKNTQGEPVASGVYFYTLKAGEFAATRKMLILK